MLKYTWVIGSIWGGVIGDPILAIPVVVVTKNSYLKELAARQ